MTPWLRVKSSDPRARELRDRHYSTDRPGGRTVGPPGRRIVLVTVDGRAAWITHYPEPALAMDGINALRCTLFRKEVAGRASDMIREAMAISEDEYGPAPDGWLTYVEPGKVAGEVPGYCFRRAGFHRDRAFKHRKLIRLRRGALLALDGQQGEPKAARPGAEPRRPGVTA